MPYRKQHQRYKGPTELSFLKRIENRLFYFYIKAIRLFVKKNVKKFSNKYVIYISE